MPREIIEWHRVADKKPDAETTVLICIPSNDEPIWLGWFENDQWYSVDGMEQIGVTMWAHLPTGDVT